MPLDQSPLFVLCHCGCGTPLPPTNKRGKPSTFAHGHNRRNPTTPTGKRRTRLNVRQYVKEQEPSIPCACGCGTLLPPLTQHGLPSRFVKGHHFRGKTHTEETRTKISARVTAHYDFIGRADATWTRWTDPRYARWRTAVLERDRWTCVQCGHVGVPGEKGFAAHHIQPYATHPERRYDVSNGQTYCRPCHMRLHGIALKPRTLIQCACGCGEWLTAIDRYGNERRYINWHWNHAQRTAGYT